MGFTFEFVMCSIAFAALASFSEAGPAASIDGDGAVDAWRVAAFALLAAYPFAAEARRRLRHEPYPGTTAVITGGSCGIGYELARSFAASGHHLALVGRSQDTLDARCARRAAPAGPAAAAAPPLAPRLARARPQRWRRRAVPPPLLLTKQMRQIAAAAARPSTAASTDCRRIYVPV